MIQELGGMSGGFMGLGGGGGGGGGGSMGSAMGSGAESSVTGGGMATGMGASGNTPPAGIDWLGHFQSGMKAWNQSQQNQPQIPWPGSWSGFNSGQGSMGGNTAQFPQGRGFNPSAMLVPIMALLSMMRGGQGGGTPFELSGYGPSSGPRNMDTNLP